jgi:hypothetical protein
MRVREMRGVEHECERASESLRERVVTKERNAFVRMCAQRRRDAADVRIEVGGYVGASAQSCAGVGDVIVRAVRWTHVDAC